MAIQLSKITAPTAADVCRHYELSDDARPLLSPQMRPAEFLEVLLERSLLLDAVRLIAHGLGRREAVWWACVCVRSTLVPGTPPAAVAALRAAETWDYEPSEERRWAAYDAAEATNYDHPAGWAAIGAFWSGHSLTKPIRMPAGLAPPPPVPPGPFLTARAVSNAVMISALAEEPERVPDRYRLFLRRGIDIANGGTGAV